MSDEELAEGRRLQQALRDAQAALSHWQKEHEWGGRFNDYVAAAVASGGEKPDAEAV